MFTKNFKSYANINKSLKIYIYHLCDDIKNKMASLLF